MYYSYVEIEYVATSFSPARTDLAVKLISNILIWTSTCGSARYEINPYCVPGTFLTLFLQKRPTLVNQR